MVYIVVLYARFKCALEGMQFMDKFKLVSEYKPTGDQPQAIDKLVKGLNNGLKELAHNKTLAAQLCSEFKEMFPENAVEYFVS